MEPVSMDGLRTVALVGLGGYGEIYVNTLLSAESASRVTFIAGVDPALERCPRLADLQERRIPLYKSLEEFTATGRRADLVILSTPLQLHCEQACYMLANGFHVLCEKPLGAHPDQTRQMIEVRDRSSLQLAIGYQWSYSAAIQNLKRDIFSGRYGRAKRLRTRVYWPRDEKYYTRSTWAGRQRDPAGRPVYDSPANNACAHHLHNMFYVLGETPQQSDWPSMVQAELYRANPIENYDTIAMRSRTENGAEIYFFASHATQKQCNPTFIYEFENGTVQFGGKFGNSIVGQKTDGTQVNYGSPAAAESVEKLFDVLDCIGSNRPVVCGPEAAGAQTACIFAAQQSTPVIVDFPKDVVVVNGNAGERRIHVKDLEKTLDQCYENSALPSERGTPWAVRSAEIAVSRRSAAGEAGALHTTEILQPVKGARRMALKN
jgi:predicted dehydrogenase